MELALLVPKEIGQQFKLKTAEDGVFVRSGTRLLLESAINGDITVSPESLEKAKKFEKQEEKRLEQSGSSTRSYRGFHRMIVQDVSPEFLEAFTNLSREVGRHIYCSALILTYLESLNFVVRLRHSTNGNRNDTN